MRVGSCCLTRVYVVTINAHARSYFKIARKKRYVEVQLNGIPRPNCFYADGRRGVIREFALNSEGNKYLTPEGKLATRELRGHVKWIRAF